MTSIILVDIENTILFNKIKCIKKDINSDSDLKYIALSYRWGEVEAQLVETPDYTARVTAFDLNDFIQLCHYIKNEKDLKHIPYLWIASISFDQENMDLKKGMVDIYKASTYILAVPDLHMKHLMVNSAILEMIDLIKQHSKNIYKEILDYSNDNSYSKDKEDGLPTTSMASTMPILQGEKELRKVYQFLTYLLDEWSNRVWTINELQIAKKKYEQHGTPLKYMFLTLLSQFPMDTFFSFSFNLQPIDNLNERELTYCDVDNGRTLVKYLALRFIKRSFLNMILNSNASRNQDRFTAILPSWKKYSHFIKDENTISNWNITSMMSVRLKLYEIMDLWDKAYLLGTCSNNYSNPILIPTFATLYSMNSSDLFEKNNCDLAYKIYKEAMLNNINAEENERKRIEQYIENYKIENGSIYTENLVNIQLRHYNDHPDQQYISQVQPPKNYYHSDSNYYLTVQSNLYFIRKLESNRFDYAILSNLSLKNEAKKDDWVDYVYLPFFTFAIPDYVHTLPPTNCSGIYLLGNRTQNRWILFKDVDFDSEKYQIGYSFKSDHYIFNII
ncbi:unnamed protein product [Cunninghamella blakesleeana]